ncbi:histidine phosphatase family protein [Roseovarius salis]|uniref:histidine phosphatase family protein n=1 Tax=Roseovarius salis TaxID=3376063 RepID=UPI0037CA2E6B
MGLSAPELWILRHGETAWNVEGRLQGHLDSPLTENGYAQARTQREILRRGLPRGVTVVSSPSERALETARIVAEPLGLSVACDEALREVRVGQWQGRRIDEIAAELPRGATDDPHLWKFGAPGGERIDEMVARLTGLVARLDGPTVLVTHGVTSRVLRCLLLGRPPTELSTLPGGQGIVHHVKGGVARVVGA